MKILITTSIFPPRIGGPASYTSQLIKQSKDHQFTLITLTPNSKPQPNTTIISIPSPKLPLVGNLLAQLLLFFQVLFQSLRADVIYSQDPLVVGLASVLAAKISSKPLVIKFVGDIPWETYSKQTKKPKTLEAYYESHPSSLAISLQRFVLHSSNQIITPSNYLKNFLTRIHRVDTSKIAVIPNPVEIEPINRRKIPHQLIYVGRLVPWKNIDQIINAVKKARHKNPWHLVIVGEGPLYQQLKQQVRKLKAKDWVTFTGSLTKEKTHQLIAQSQKLILYSSYEGQPHTLIESILLNTPVIASQIKPNLELLGSVTNLVPLNDTTALAQAINQSNPNIISLSTQFQKNHTWKNHLSLLNSNLNHAIKQN